MFRKPTARRLEYLSTQDRSRLRLSLGVLMLLATVGFGTAAYGQGEQNVLVSGNITDRFGNFEVLEPGDAFELQIPRPIGAPDQTFEDANQSFARWNLDGNAEIRVTHDGVNYDEVGVAGLWGQSQGKGSNGDAVIIEFLVSEPVTMVGGSVFDRILIFLVDSSATAVEPYDQPLELVLADFNEAFVDIEFVNASQQLWGVEGTVLSIGSGGGGDSDYDDDGVPDKGDNCPIVANPMQDDFDSDGVGTLCDNCPLDPNPDQGNIDLDQYGDACDFEDNRIVQVRNVSPETALSNLRDAISAANAQPNTVQIVIVSPGEVLADEYLNTGSALPDLFGQLDLRGSGSAPVTIAPGIPLQNDFNFIEVKSGGSLRGANLHLQGFGNPTGNGGTFSIDAGGSLYLDRVSIEDSEAPQGLGGGIYYQRSPGGRLRITDSDFNNNLAELGGSIFTDGFESGDLSSWTDIAVDRSRFKDNQATEGGCDIAAEGSPDAGFRFAPRIDGSSFTSMCAKELLHTFSEQFRVGASQLENTGTGEAVEASEGSVVESFLSQYFGPYFNNQQLQSDAGRTKKDDACDESDGGSVDSLGYNLVSDNSCTLGEPTDLVGVNPMLSAPDADGIRSPLAGSPVIDHGPAGLVDVDGLPWQDLPCGWKDIYGLGRPQDGDGDGGFECDIGPVELQGAGAISAGTSGTFVDPLRGGEGQFVEILDDTRAVIFTFTYRPDGSGPAWFFGNASIVGNSLVASNVLHPVGAKWGDAFDPADVWLQSWGGKSMVFPDCEASANMGNVALSGSGALGFRPLITRAQRLTHIAGCGGQVTPGPNAGLSGSFGDPARNGEGLVVEWLPDGRVAVVMFTYDLEGKQLWIVGSGTPVGKTVTINAFYPVGFPAWNEDPDPADVNVVSWGTFTLNYTDCDNFVFSWNSTVQGYGSGQANYTRITYLQGLSCPEF